MWLILVPVLQGGFEDEVSCTLAFRAVVLLPLLSPMTLFTWVWDGEKDTLHLQHLSPPALSKYAPASVQWVVKVQHPYCCEICFGDEGDGDSKHRCTGTRLIKYICDSDSVVSRALHSRPVVRFFASQNIVQVPSDAERLHLLDPRNHTSRSHKPCFKCKGLERVPKASPGVSRSQTWSSLLVIG